MLNDEINRHFADPHTQQQAVEEIDRGHRRREMDAFAELDMIDAAIHAHGEIMKRACRAGDPGCHPSEEPVGAPGGQTHDPVGSPRDKAGPNPVDEFLPRM